MGSRKDYLGPSTGYLHTYDIGTDPITLAVTLAWNLLFFRKDGVRSSQVYNNISLFKPLDDPVDQLPFTALKFIVDNLTLRISNFLHNILLRCLSSDATKRTRVHLVEKLVAQLGIGIEVFSGLI